MLKLFFVFFSATIFTAQAVLIKQKNHPPPLYVPKDSNATTPIWGTIVQKLDHYNPADTRNWTMRYLYNEECFKDGGPIIIYIGGEWTISESSLMTGIAYDLACENGGYMFYTEHRYYGESYPTESFTTENLKYLSADQALQDLVYFIQYQKENTPGLQNSSVVVIGGSYSATLATWARVKYPHLIDIAYASSAPLNAKADFVEYFKVVYDNMLLTSETCVSTLASAISQLEEKLETEEGITEASTLFQTCETINTTEPHRAYFFQTIAVIFAGTVQYALDGDIEYICHNLENKTGTDLEKLAAFVIEYYGPDVCISSYQYMVEYYQNTTLSDTSSRPWIYQTCTEYGWFQTTTNDYNFLGDAVNVELSYQTCTDLFGEIFTGETVNNGVKRTNLMYGSYEPEVTRLITVHGSVDPWHPMGVLEDLNPYALTYFINGSSHCLDMSSVSEWDSDQMKDTKLAVRSIISKWLEEISSSTSYSKATDGTSAANCLQNTLLLLFITVIFTLKNLNQ